MDGAQTQTTPRKRRTKYGFRPLSDEDKGTLEKVYRDDGVFAGRDRLYFYVKEKYPDFKGSQRAVLDWLKHQENWQLSQIPRKHTTVAPLKITKPGYIQADLAILTSYKDRGFDGYLAVVDGFSKFVWCRALRGQSEDTVVDAMKSILDSVPAGRFSVCQTDRGSHFQAKFVKLLEDHGVRHLYSKARHPTSNAFVERIGVGNVKRMLFAHMRQTDLKKWVEYLPKAVEHLNNLRSCATGMTPNELVAASLDKQQEVAEKIVSNLNRKHKGKATTRILHVGQKVRLKRDLGTMNKANRKGYWTESTYTIVKRFKSRHPNILATYKVRASNGRDMPGKYSKSDLLVIPPFLDKDHEVHEDPTPALPEPIPEAAPARTPTPEPESQPRRSTRAAGEYLVDFIHGKRRRKVNGRYRLEYRVRWVAYGPEHDTWEPLSHLKNAKQAVEDFERNG